MKKIISFLLSLFIIVILSSCNAQDNFLSKFDSTMNRIAKGKVVTTDVTINLTISDGTRTQEETERMQIQVGEDPIYIMTEYNDRKTIIMEENDNIYQYVENFGRLNEKELLCSKSEYLTDYNQSTINDGKDLGIDLDSVYEEDGLYVIKGTYSEIFDLDSGLGEFYKSLGIDTEEIGDTPLRIEFEFGVSNIIIKMYTTSVTDDHSVFTVVKMDIHETSSSDAGWYGIVPTYELKDYKNIKVGDIVEFSDNVYKMELSKGQYALISDNYYDYNDNEYDIYDSHGLKIDIKFPIQWETNDFEKATFVIPEEATYYIKTNNNYGKVSKLVELKYDSIFTEGNTISVGTYSGTIDGPFEFAKYVINSEFDGVIKLTNNSSSNSFSIIESNPVYYPKHRLEDSPVYIKLNKGENVFYVSTNDVTVNKQDYSFNVEFYEYQAAPMTAFDNLVELNEEPTEKLYPAGLNLPKLYFKFIVPEDAYYSFHTENIIEGKYFNNYCILIYDASTNELVYNGNTHMSYLMKAGNYIVELSCDSDDIVIGTPHYNYIRSA